MSAATIAIDTTAALAVTDLGAWHRDGYLHIPGVLDAAGIAELRSWTDEISAHTPGESGVLQHYERTVHGPALARSERLLEAHLGFRALMTDGALPFLAATLLGEPAVLYKEKINHKLAGGAGFAPHQDAPAYKFVDTHLTGMLAIDDATIDNGCLDVVAGAHEHLLPLDDDGCIRDDVAADLDWQPVPVAAGDMLWFHSRAPHRSGPNDTTTTRRALFCTYNAAALGDLRATYYADKAEYFTANHSDQVRVSTIGDFQGIAPSEDELRSIGVIS